MKNKDILLDMIGETDENLVPELTAKKARSSIIKWIALGGVSAAAVFACAAILPKLGGDNKVSVSSSKVSEDTVSSVSETSENESSIPARKAGAKAELLSEAVYPEMVQYPDASKVTDYNELQPLLDEWRKSQDDLQDQPEGYQDGFKTFFLNSTQTFLNDSSTENMAYSPLSLYMALGISAEITDGSSRQQILNVLDENDIEALRSNSRSIWQANFMDDGMSKCILASSFWTNSFAEYNKATVNRLSENYYSTVYSGDPSADEYNKMYQDWLNAQTDGLLGDQVKELKLDPDMVLSIASTVNYSGKWMEKFKPEDTKQGDFHAADGDVKCDFMNMDTVKGYSWGDHFSSISMALENNGQMRLILPDEGYTPYDLLNDDQAKELMINGNEYKNCKAATVTLSVPKFDVTSSIDLQDGLESLGIKDIFDAGKSDFSPLTENSDGIFISKAEQDTRVTIDEEGCKAVSMTVIGGMGGGTPDEHEDFIVDRPFIFEIVSNSGLPLFVGIVNNPAM